MMKKLLMLASLLFAFAVFAGTGLSAQENADWANYGRYAEANKTAQRGADAVFMGNSITQGWANSRPDFFADNNYIGRGIGGQVTAQMLARFRADVLDLQPKCVVILAGTNDIAQNQGFVSIENIFGNIVSMTELAKAHDMQVVICSVLPAYEYRWRPGIEPAAKIAALNTLLKVYATGNGCYYVDFHSVMKDERGGLPEKYAKDGVHPTQEGYEVMESLIKPVIDKTIEK